MPSERITRAHEAITANLPDCTESLETVRLVHDYREYWRPERIGRKTRVVLIGELHRYTPDWERLPTANPKMFGLDGCPEDFVRTVYCLGYGEPDLLVYPVQGNSSTPQFWKVFFACIHRITDFRSFAPVQKSGCPSLLERLENKISLLRSMQKRGIWLLDASVVALKGDERQVFRQTALDASWREYLWPLLSEIKPACVIMIGRRFGDVLGRRLSELPLYNEVFAQPQAQLSAEEHMRQYIRYYELCRDYAHSSSF